MFRKAQTDGIYIFSKQHLHLYMRKQAICTVFILVAVFLQSCNNHSYASSADNAKVIRINFDQTPECIHTIGLIDSLKIISLNTPYDNIIIGEIDKVVRFDDKLYLLDIRQTRSVFIFNTNGDFINVISNFGQGPGEYLQLNDIFINRADSTLNLLCRIGQRLFVYDLTGKNLLRIEAMPKPFSRITRMKNGYAADMGNWRANRQLPYSLWLLCDTLSIVSYHVRINPLFESRGIGGMQHFSYFQDHTYFIALFDYNVYSISNTGEVEVKYRFDLGALTLTERRLRRYSRGNTDLLVLLNRYRTIEKFQETQNHLITQVLHRGQFLLGIYNKNTEQVRIAELTSYIGRYWFSFGRIVSFDENTIYSLLDAERVRRIWLGEDEWGNNFAETHPEQVRNLQERFAYIDEEDNPHIFAAAKDTKKLEE